MSVWLCVIKTINEENLSLEESSQGIKKLLKIILAELLKVVSSKKQKLYYRCLSKHHSTEL